jgi:hypothetical protein
MDFSWGTVVLPIGQQGVATSANVEFDSGEDYTKRGYK